MSGIYLSAKIASAILWVLSGFGLLGIFILIPVLSAELSDQYVEYRGDKISIQLILSFLTACIVAVTVIIALLLRKVKQGNLLRESSKPEVRALSITFFTLAISIIILFVWLSNQNTMPPGLVLILFGGFAVSVAAGLTTRSLSGVLVEAISNREELEEVI